jgi:hypothetical protein
MSRAPQVTRRIQYAHCTIFSAPDLVFWDESANIPIGIEISTIFSANIANIQKDSYVKAVAWYLQASNFFCSI